jgi:hypothetical protein
MAERNPILIERMTALVGPVCSCGHHAIEHDMSIDEVYATRNTMVCTHSSCLNDKPGTYCIVTDAVRHWALTTARGMVVVFRKKRTA